MTFRQPGTPIPSAASIVNRRDPKFRHKYDPAHPVPHPFLSEKNPGFIPERLPVLGDDKRLPHVKPAE